MISINSKRTPPPPRQGTFNHQLTQAGLLLAVFAASLLLTACPSPGGGGGTTTPNGGGTATPDGGNPTPPAPESEKPTPPTPEPPTPKPKAWHVTTFAGGNTSGIEDGIGTAASFSLPYSIAQSGDTLYVTDGSYHSIRTIDTTTVQVGTIVPGGLLAAGYLNGAGTSARLNGPSGIVAAGGNTLYVADRRNHRIREVLAGASAAATQVSLLAGSGTAGHADDTGAAAQFSSPIALALNGTMLYVADMNNHRIRAVDLASPDKIVSTIAGSGTAGDADGKGSTAQFNRPSGLAVSGTTLYVADSDNHRIRAVNLTSPEKTVSTIAGSGTAGYADGTGSTAQFNRPSGLAVSGTTLYVADRSNHRIRAVDLAVPDKTVSTIAGDGTEGRTNGIGTAAQFSSPLDIAASGSTLYVTSGVQIRKLEYREVGS